MKALHSASKMLEPDANVNIVAEIPLPLMRGFCVTQAKFRHHFHFTSTFKCFIRSSAFVFDVWCC